jgi:hypothetical protein
MLAASAVLVDAVYQMVHGVCDALGTSEKNTIIAKWTGALTTMVLLFFSLEKQESNYRLNKRIGLLILFSPCVSDYLHIYL